MVREISKTRYLYLSVGLLPVVLVSVILHRADGTVVFVQTVGALHIVSVTRFVLLFDVSGMGVMHLIRELVFSWALCKNQN